jgi:hypothetical protein
VVVQVRLLAVVFQGPQVVVAAAGEAAPHLISLVVMLLGLAEPLGLLVEHPHRLEHPLLWLSINAFHLMIPHGYTYRLRHRRQSPVLRPDGRRLVEEAQLFGDR